MQSFKTVTGKLFARESLSISCDTWERRYRNICINLGKLTEDLLMEVQAGPAGFNSYWNMLMNADNNVAYITVQCQFSRINRWQGNLVLFCCTTIVAVLLRTCSQAGNSYHHRSSKSNGWTLGGLRIIMTLHLHHYDTDASDGNYLFESRNCSHIQPIDQC